MSEKLKYQVAVTITLILTLKLFCDHTESLFGANDWLDRILPNLSQATKSTMIEFKTLEWLKFQGEEQKQALIKLAQERRLLSKSSRTLLKNWQKKDFNGLS